MSLSKKKFSFNPKKKENKELNNNIEVLDIDENKNELKEKKNPIINPRLSIDDLIFKDNSLNQINKENNSSNQLSEIVVINHKINDEKKESGNIESNSNIQYIINQNDVKNIDFINILLKLKGISIDPNKGYKSSKNLIFNQKLEDENIFEVKTHNTNSNKLLNNNYKYNKSIPTNCSTSISKINSINYNYHNNENEEEENLKYLNTGTFSTNGINNNLDNINNSKNNINNKNLIKIEKYSSLKELTTSKKINGKNNTNEEEISLDFNFNDTTKQNIRNKNNKVDCNESKESSLKKSKNMDNKYILKTFEGKNNTKKKFNKNSIEKNMDDKIIYKKSLSNKSILKKNSVEKKKYKYLGNSEKKISKNKLIKRIHYDKKPLYEKNNNYNKYNEKSNSKEKKYNSNISCICLTDKKINKEENLKKDEHKNKIINIPFKKISNKIKRNELINKNLIVIHTNNKNKSNKKIDDFKEINKNFNTENMKEENNIEKMKKRISNEKVKKIMVDKKVKKKNNNSQIKEIDIKNKKNIVIFNKKTFEKIKNNPLKNKNISNIKFNKEIKQASLIKALGKIKIKKKVISERNNNISYLTSRKNSNNNIIKNKKVNSLSSYSKREKNKNFISPSSKKKIERNGNIYNNNQVYNEDINKSKEHSFLDFTFKNNIIINNSISINNFNNKKEKDKNDNIFEVLEKNGINTSDLLNKIVESSLKEKKEENLNKEKDLNDGKFKNNSTNEIKTEIKKNKTSKFVEIYLFDNNKEEKSIEENN